MIRDGAGRRGHSRTGSLALKECVAWRETTRYRSPKHGLDVRPRERCAHQVWASRGADSGDSHVDDEAYSRAGQAQRRPECSSRTGRLGERRAGEGIAWCPLTVGTALSRGGLAGVLPPMDLTCRGVFTRFAFLKGGRWRGGG